MKKKFWLKRAAMVVVFVPLALFVFGSIVMLLWNAILPGVIHVSAINFWQALGILVLSKILFGGFRGGWRGNPRHHWKDRMQTKLSQMTPEEKEKFKQNWKNRCSGWSSREGENSNQAKPFEHTKSGND